jgi:hypothetical protein
VFAVGVHWESERAVILLETELMADYDSPEPVVDRSRYTVATLSRDDARRLAASLPG